MKRFKLSKPNLTRYADAETRSWLNNRLNAFGDNGLADH